VAEGRPAILAGFLEVGERGLDSCPQILEKFCVDYNAECILQESDYVLDHDRYLHFTIGNVGILEKVEAQVVALVVVDMLLESRPIKVLFVLLDDDERATKLQDL